MAPLGAPSLFSWGFAFKAASALTHGRGAEVHHAIHLLPMGGKLEAAEDDQSGVSLDAADQPVGLDGRKTAVTVIDLRALAKQGIGLVEEDDRARVGGRVKHGFQVLLG